MNSAQIPPNQEYDAVVVGSGPNGLSAAIVLAQAGASVLVLEAGETVGGGTRSAELTLPGYIHDVCAAILPLTIAAPFFKTLPLKEYGLEWVSPPAAVAHPLDGGRAAILEGSVEKTARTLGEDEKAYRRLMKPFVENWEAFAQDVLGPLPLPPKHPFIDLRFAWNGLRPALSFGRSHFKGELARGLFAGNAAHSMLPLDQVNTASFGIMLGGLGHAVGWPMARGGTQRVADSLAAYLRSLGGEIVTGFRVDNMRQLPPAQAVLFDVTPRQLLSIAGNRLPQSYRRKLEGFRYGPGVFKIDWALNDPIPWENKDVRRGGTVHVGGSLEEIAEAEGIVGRGKHPERPFVLLAQQSLFDPSRAPHGKHTAWAYCHVPNGSTVDMTERIEMQIERFAPGFRDTILARRVMNTEGMQEYNNNYVGGDINGGIQDIWQFFTRPVWSLNPYVTPAKGIYLCSSSTPPGGGVHGMCGYHAARAALKRMH